MIFESDPDQIKQLNSVTLVKLMKRLILSECRLVDIPLRGVSVPLQITVADGGEDARVGWTSGMDETDYFPSRFCLFQSKAQNLTACLLKSEILKNQKKGPPKLNAAISEVLSRHGAYIVFCSHPFSPKKSRSFVRRFVRLSVLVEVLQTTRPLLRFMMRTGYLIGSIRMLPWLFG